MCARSCVRYGWRAPVSAAVRFSIGDEIGRGALGRVVLVHDEITGAVMAGKILHESHQDDEAARARFAGESRILRGIEHPNLVHVLGVHRIEDQDVLVMEYIDGPSLASVIARDAPLGEARIVRLGRGLAAGLGAAHHGGLVHRDLKPANVLVREGDEPTIVDFGMARATSLDGVDPSAFAIVGTPAYMAPESLEPLAVDARSDIYALGCILFELATGAPPYTAATAFACLEAHRTAPIPPIGDSLALSPGLCALIEWCLQKSPADRPQSASVVERVLAELTTSERPGMALARRGESALESSGVCAACGERLVTGVPVCFGCGLAQAGLDRGRFSLFVIGPGRVTNKIDAAQRQRLLDWLRDNPSLGLDPAPLAKRVPRLPFLLATGVSEASARQLSVSLERLGFECAVRKGSRFALPEMRTKAWRLGGRVAAIVVGSSIGVWNAAHYTFALPAALAGAAVSVASGWYLAGRRVARQKHVDHRAPLALRAPLDRVAGVLPAIEARRHREGLRAVVQRVVDMHRFLSERDVRGFDEELARMLDLAVVAATRIDELEASLAAEDLRDPRDELRASLRERDMWAARLLEAAAFLDALRARYAALGAAGPDAEAATSSLAELRRHVEALREVQQL